MKRGMTLIEVLISITIFAIICTMSTLTTIQIYNIQNFNRIKLQMHTETQRAMDWIEREVNLSYKVGFITEGDRSDIIKFYQQINRYAEYDEFLLVYKNGDKFGSIVGLTPYPVDTSEPHYGHYHDLFSSELKLKDLKMEISSNVLTVTIVVAPADRTKLKSLKSPLLGTQNVSDLTYTLKSSFYVSDGLRGGHEIN
jgi:prepilin-type N-terminal cleavage/methylation domain-containing protein